DPVRVQEHQKHLGLIRSPTGSVRTEGPIRAVDIAKPAVRLVIVILVPPDSLKDRRRPPKSLRHQVSGIARGVHASPSPPLKAPPGNRHLDLLPGLRAEG